MNTMIWMKKLALSALIGASAIAALPADAEARDRHHRHSYDGHRDHDRYRDYRSDYRRDYRRDHRRGHYRDRYYCRRGSGTTGLIVGGAAGAPLRAAADGYGSRHPRANIGAAPWWALRRGCARRQAGGERGGGWGGMM